MTSSYDAVTPPRVLVTRPAEDAPGLAGLLGRHGYEAVVVPLLERRWRIDAVLQATVDHPEVDWVVVTSGTTAQILAVAAPSAWSTAKWAAVGPATAARLRQLGLPVDQVGAKATARHLIDALGDLTDQRVLYPRADAADPATLAAIADAGGHPVDVVAYDNVAPDGHRARLRSALPVAATTLMSGSAARRLAAALPAGADSLGSVVCIGPSTAAAARGAGLPVHAVADPHSVAGLMDALNTLFVSRGP